MQNLGKKWHTLGKLESLSLIVLVTVAMPLKYLAAQPLPVRIIGMIHGLLFLSYVGLALLLALKRKWALPQLIGAWVSAWVPFGYMLISDDMWQD